MPKNSKQVSNVERRTWDKEVYEAKARARTAANSSSSEQNQSGERILGQPVTSKNGEPIEEEFIAAEAGAAGPEKSERAFLRARKATLKLDSKVGKIEAIAPDAAAISSTKPVTDSALQINSEVSLVLYFYYMSRGEI